MGARRGKGTGQRVKRDRKRRLDDRRENDGCKI